MSKARATTASSSRNACSLGSLAIAAASVTGAPDFAHQLGQLVDLAIGHLQHAPDVAQHAARLQGAEGDDLGDLIAP